MRKAFMQFLRFIPALFLAACGNCSATKTQECVEKWLVEQGIGLG